MFELAHLTDLHIGPVPDPSFTDLMSKRFFGYLSWRRKRHLMHRPEVLEALLKDLLDNPVDHIAMSGDLVNIALMKEFENAAGWLARFGNADLVSLVPGNHDAYLEHHRREGWELWAPYMAMDGSEEIQFPYVRKRGPLTLIGLSSAIPTSIFYAYGALGKEQLSSFEQILTDAQKENSFIVIMVHHPPLQEIHSRRNLRDNAEFRQIVQNHGADLVLCGHQHRFQVSSIAGRNGLVPVIVGPSASMDFEGHPDDGGYVRLGIDAEKREIFLGWRRFDASSGRFETAIEGRIETDAKGAHIASG